MCFNEPKGASYYYHWEEDLSPRLYRHRYHHHHRHSTQHHHHNSANSSDSGSDRSSIDYSRGPRASYPHVRRREAPAEVVYVSR